MLRFLYRTHWTCTIQSALDTYCLSPDGIVIIGGDDSNTNAAILAEYFMKHDSQTKIVGVPKTIDGDLRNEYIEASFGFDTAVKTYAEFIGNLSADIATSGKYYHFVRLMGRTASHITLQCALLTRPNLTFIGEEVHAKSLSLKDLVDELVDMIIRRQDQGKDFGIVLVPEGLIEFIPEVCRDCTLRTDNSIFTTRFQVGALIQEINNILATGDFNVTKLTSDSAVIFNSLPSSIKDQLLLDRDPHGNIQISRIATERLLILMSKEKLNAMGRGDRFIPRSHFFGCVYQGNKELLATYSYVISIVLSCYL